MWPRPDPLWPSFAVFVRAHCVLYARKIFPSHLGGGIRTQDNVQWAPGVIYPKQHLDPFSHFYTMKPRVFDRNQITQIQRLRGCDTAIIGNNRLLYWLTKCLIFVLSWMAIATAMCISVHTSYTGWSIQVGHGVMYVLPFCRYSRATRIYHQPNTRWSRQDP